MRRLTVLTIATAVLVAGCSPRPGEFSASLGKIVRSGSAEVDLASVLPLRWDRLYLFAPYSSRERNCELLQLASLECQSTLPSSIDEHEFFLVFKLASSIVHTEHHWRSNGDFVSPMPPPQPVLRSSARFAIKLVSNRAADGERWYQLEHVAGRRAQ